MNQIFSEVLNDERFFFLEQMAIQTLAWLLIMVSYDLPFLFSLFHPVVSGFSRSTHGIWLLIGVVREQARLEVCILKMKSETIDRLW